jgi:hypothetical protein
MPPPMSSLPHIHLLLNHVPTIGTLIALCLFLASLATKSVDMQRASLVLFVGIAVITLPTYVTGNAAEDAICIGAANAPCQNPEVSRALIQAHEGAALLAFVAMQITGGFAWLGLWKFRRISQFPRWNLVAVLILSLVSFGLMARAANIGGGIRHPEVGITQQTEAGDAPVAREVGAYVLAVRWIWPTCETLHFVGLCLLFGITAIVDLRVLGLIRGVSFSALHRMLPWGVLGFGMNLFTGMFFFVAAYDQYTKNAVFIWKLALIMVAAINLLYFTMFDGPWDLGPKDDAPFRTKFAAASALALVVGVIFCGRMLPFLGNAF